MTDVLLIDDEDDSRGLVALVLERAGYRVTQARGWNDALSCTEGRDGIRLIVTDIVMPDHAGVDVFNRLRSRCGAIPVIVLSGYPHAMRLLDGVLDGVVEWLRKPSEVETLVHAVNAAVRAPAA
jgi:two-component system, cell cycle sensor histidine kinase and response regulator CckA